MTEEFRGTINLDVRDSIPDWTPYTLKRAPDGAPNVLVVLYDDTGQAAWSPYGGRINMPTLDRLAQNGLTYTQWHTTALCSPTRSTMLTGRNHHVNRFAAITETANGFPGAAGRLPAESATIGQVLQENGYSTFWLGKNHNVPEEDIASGGSRSEWPLNKGFDRFYGFLGGETNQWYPDLVEDNRFVEPPATPEEGYHLSKDLAD
jgi:arylsulfatase